MEAWVAINWQNIQSQVRNIAQQFIAQKKQSACEQEPQITQKYVQMLFRKTLERILVS